MYISYDVQGVLGYSDENIFSTGEILYINLTIKELSSLFKDNNLFLYFISITNRDIAERKRAKIEQIQKSIEAVISICDGPDRPRTLINALMLLKVHVVMHLTLYKDKAGDDLLDDSYVDHLFALINECKDGLNNNVKVGGDSVHG